MKTCNFIQLGLCHRCLSINIPKILELVSLRSNYGRLLLKERRTSLKDVPEVTTLRICGHVMGKTYIQLFDWKAKKKHFENLIKFIFCVTELLLDC